MAVIGDGSSQKHKLCSACWVLVSYQIRSAAGEEKSKMSRWIKDQDVHLCQQIGQKITQTLVEDLDYYDSSVKFREAVLEKPKIRQVNDGRTKDSDPREHFYSDACSWNLHVLILIFRSLIVPHSSVCHSSRVICAWREILFYGIKYSGVIKR